MVCPSALLVGRKNKDAFTPQRCVWGSDWPFLRMPMRMDYGPVLANLERWIPDPGARRQVLWETPARLFGLHRKGAIEVGREADLVLFDPAARRTIRAEDLHHTSDYTPYEGLNVAGAIRSTFVRGRAVVRDGAYVGDRGYGQFVERGPAGG